MRILRFSHDYLLNVGGLQVHLRGLNRELARCGIEIDQAFLVGQDDFPTLIGKRRLVKVGDGHFQQSAMVNLFPCIVPNRYATVPEADSPEAVQSFEKQFAKIIHDRRPDLVHVHILKHPVQYRALELASQAGIATAMSHHEGFPQTCAQDEYLQRGAALADLRLAVSRHAALSIRARPTDYIGYFVDTEFWQQSKVLPSGKEYWRTRLQRVGAEVLFVYPARFSPRKHQDLLVRAAHELKRLLSANEAVRGFKVVLVGETIPRRREYLQHLVELVESLSLREHVCFLEVQSQENLRALLSISDALVYPAFNEAGGRSHLEGMVVGACAIVANDAGLTEHVVDEQNGLTFSPYSEDELAAQMHRVIRFPEWRKRLAEAGRETASKLTLHRYAQDHIQLYKSQLEKRRLTDAAASNGECISLISPLSDESSTPRTRLFS